MTLLRNETQAGAHAGASEHVRRARAAAKAARCGAAGGLAQVQRERVVGQFQAMRAFLQRRHCRTPRRQLRILCQNSLLRVVPSLLGSGRSLTGLTFTSET